MWRTLGVVGAIVIGWSLDAPSAVAQSVNAAEPVAAGGAEGASAGAAEATEAASEAAVKEWQIVENGAASGPFSTDEIVQKIESGALTAEQLIWKPGMANWAAASTVVPFDAQFAASPTAAEVAPPPVPPAAEAATSAPMETAAPTDAAPRSSGWALAGSIVGYTASVIILGTGAAAAAIYETDTSVPLGAAAWSTNIIFGPVVFASGASARHRGGVRGSLGLRISAWVFYGIAVAVGAAEIGLGAAGEDVPIGAIIPAVITTTVSQLCFSTDALVAAIQVRRANASVARRAPENRLTVGPMLAPTASSQYGSGGLLGLAGTF